MDTLPAPFYFIHLIIWQNKKMTNINFALTKIIFIFSIKFVTLSLFDLISSLN
jgi:hypothetical protein